MVTFTDKMVRIRKKRICHACEMEFTPGQTLRYLDMVIGRGNNYKRIYLCKCCNEFLEGITAAQLKMEVLGSDEPGSLYGNRDWQIHACLHYIIHEEDAPVNCFARAAHMYQRRFESQRNPNQLRIDGLNRRYWGIDDSTRRRGQDPRVAPYGIDLANAGRFHTVSSNENRALNNFPRRETAHGMRLSDQVIRLSEDVGITRRSFSVGDVYNEWGSNTPLGIIQTRDDRPEMYVVEYTVRLF